MRSRLTLLLLFVGALVRGQESFQVLNSVHFGVHEAANGNKDDKVTLRLTVINVGTTKIPDLGVSNRSKLVNFYINGEKSNPLSLYNGAEMMKGEKVILQGDTGTFDNSWVLTENAGIIEKYGTEFNVQWEYNGVRSEVLKVNLEYKTAQRLIIPTKDKPKIDPERKEEFDFVVSHADRAFENKNYYVALEKYKLAKSIFKYDDYVNAQIKICEEKLGIKH